MATASAAIEAYLRAKDESRPFLMSQAFAEDATLAMTVNADAISFPPQAHGRDAITTVLVRDFGKTYENVRTLCLSAPPARGALQFTCPWLVGMSAKGDGSVRVGCGHYAWSFGAQSPHLVSRLHITIEAMEVLAPTRLEATCRWLFSLPWPWCPIGPAFAAAPPLPELARLRRWADKVSVSH